MNALRSLLVGVPSGGLLTTLSHQSSDEGVSQNLLVEMELELSTSEGMSTWIGGLALQI